MAAFCHGRGLANSSFFAWNRRLAGAGRGLGGLAPVEGTGFVQAEVVGAVAASVEATSPIELELRGGGRRAVVLRRGSGVEISRVTMSVWCGDVAMPLKPLHDLMVRRVLQSRVVCTDDTPMPLLSPGNGKAKTARM